MVLIGIRTALLESAEHQCPSCETPGQSPDVLIPNKYLRAMVTSFINETSYVSTKKPPASTASSAGAVVVKTETAAVADAVRRTADLSTQLIGMPPQVVHAATQIKTEPPAGTQLPVPLRTGASVTAGDQFSYHTLGSSVGRVTANQTPPSLLESVDVKYSQPLALVESGSSVSQSQSAPSLLSRSLAE